MAGAGEARIDCGLAGSRQDEAAQPDLPIGVREPALEISCLMRIRLLCAAVVALSSSANAVESTRIDGVPVHGRLHDVSAEDLREVVADATHDLSQTPSSIEVMGPDTLRAYLPERELGWIPGRRITCCLNRRWDFAGTGIAYSSEVLRFIRTATEAYVFPLPDPLKPHRDALRMRRLDASAHSELVHFLGYEHDWRHGLYQLIGTIGQLPPSVGFVFRRGQFELVLFVIEDGAVKGTFNGENKSGYLEAPAMKELESWKDRYVRAELGSQ